MSPAVFDEHSAVLASWWQLGRRPRTVVYLDAHLDLQHVNDDRMRRLEECSSTDEVAALAKPHHLRPDRGYSYGLENFLYPAARLGLIDRLVWVAPPHVPTAYTRDTFDRLCQMDGVTPDELAHLRRGAGGTVEGRLLGLEVTACAFAHLERLALPPDALIDIDIDYFVAVPGDEPWVNPRAVFEALRRAVPAPECVTISRSVGSGFTPLRYRFFADYLAALWEGRENDAEHYDRLYRLHTRARGGDRSAADACRREAESHPECPASWFLLGLAEPDPERAAPARARAGELSAAYGPDPLRSVCELRSRRLPVDLAGVTALRAWAARRPLGPEERGLVEAEFGMVYAAFGDVGRAIDCHRAATAVLGGHPELALEIAKRLVETGREAQAVALLQTALEDDKTRTAAGVLLARVAASAGELERAKAHLERASAAAPAWADLLDMRASVAEALGDAAGAAALRERADRLRRLGDEHAAGLA